MQSKNKMKQVSYTDDCEMLDIVDQNDQVVQTLSRDVVYQDNLCSQMRSVWLMIKNQHGQLWIPRRNWNLNHLPGHLDGSVSGHVQAGESYQQALLREAMEEVGYDLTGMSYQFLGKLTPHEHQAFCFSHVYECQVEQPPINWSRVDMCEWQWMSPQEIIEKMQQGEKMKTNLPLIVQHFYLNKK